MTWTGRFSEADRRQIEQHGLDVQVVARQLEIFSRGISPVRLDRPCTVGDGMVVLQEQELIRLSGIYDEAALAGRAMKFVPASGAATRMFKTLLSCYESYLKPGSEPMSLDAFTDDQGCLDVLRMKEHCGKFPFADDLRAVVAADGLDVGTLVADGRCDLLMGYLLTEKGLNYSALPKGLIAFHRYDDHVRTPFAEHLVEAAMLTRDREGMVHIHFTISPEHRQLFETYFKQACAGLDGGEIRFEVTFSTQKPSTDTIAVDADNAPFRDAAGRLVFRPGGHGALLTNLNDLQGDIVFIKNIDNVVPDRLKPKICLYEKVLGGYLVELQQQIFHYLECLSAADIGEPLLDEIADFGRRHLFIDLSAEGRQLSTDEVAAFWQDRLNRPLRVCGMVRNQGEPGGGPFWVSGREGCSRQIVESAQVDMASEGQSKIWRASTHFNPVDLVCGVRDYRGQLFNLLEFSDPDTGFIASKSKDGKDLKALEHPGLWNGAMAGWNSVFVEVPASTFNPVKTVFDLLRPEHQPA
ncbi:MAG: DUF4301 family protein [Deltaproteobacteria bacterium]|nr:DUF4301 family protein [Candidatus Anaeroferrophillus wilburensis]